MFVWAGKDVAYSESAVKIIIPHCLQRAFLRKEVECKSTVLLFNGI